MVRYPRVARLWVAALRASVAKKKRTALPPVRRKSVAQLLVANRAVS